MSEKRKKGQPAEEDAGELGAVPVPGGTQESPASGPPRISQDVRGQAVDIPLDPETGAPLEQEE